MPQALVTLAEIRAAAARIAHIAVIAFVLYTCPVFAQDRSEITVTVIVEDQGHARVPATHITASAILTGSAFAATTDANGEAVIHLVKGSYALKARASGYDTWELFQVDMNAEMRQTVTLELGKQYHGRAVIHDEELEISLEPQELATEIPTVPVQRLALSGNPLPQKLRWLNKLTGCFRNRF
jgi:hypothetical protein